jgi:filamentous hemagglutinin family protein
MNRDEGANMKSNAAMHNRPVQRTRMLRRRLLPVLIAGCFGQAAFANPQGAQVVNGQVGFSNQGSVLSVTNTPGAIINWQRFSINPGETTRFIQQNANSAVLNRITGQDPSQILGALQSNGRVFLVNPNGILFGQGAQIDVNGLVASTLNISNEDFLRGKLNFKSAGSAGSIVNQGAITTPAGGQVYLIAPNVENSGIIHSPQGDVMLAAGHTVQLVDSTDPNLQVVLSAPEHAALNIGKIITEGGKTGIYGALVHQRGMVSADSAVVGENGKIVFKASKDTLLEAGSVTSATGVGSGGEVQVLGERVGLIGDAAIDVSGRTGGGTVLVGGDYKGGNSTVQNAKRTFVSEDARITADAGLSGNGGKVIVWGDETARVHGHISARGGSVAGDGGFVETSSNYLNVDKVTVDTSAAKGKAGNWLLDPFDIFVADFGTALLNEVDEFADGYSISQIHIDTIGNALSTVQLQAKHDIALNNSIVMTNFGVGLRALAGNNISVNADITTNHGDVDLQANHPDFASLNGTVNVNAAIRTNGGGVNVSGASIALGSNALVDVGSFGPVSMTANNPGGSILLASGSRIVNSGIGTGFSFIADDMHLDGQIQAGASSVQLRPFSAGLQIELGAKVAGSFGLTASELANISTEGLQIGDQVQGNAGIHVAAPLNLNVPSLRLNTTGSITVDAPITISANAGDLVFGAKNDIVVNGAIDMSAPGSGLIARAGNSIALNADVSSRGMIGLYAADPGYSNGSATGAVNLNADLRSNGGNVELGGKTIALGATGVVDIGSGDLRMSAYGDGNGISLASNAHINGFGAGNISFIADNVNLAGHIDAGGAGGGKSVDFMPTTTGRSIDLGTKSAGTLGLNASELENISAYQLSFNDGALPPSSSSIRVSAPVNFSGPRLKTLNLYSHNGIAVDAPLSLAADGGGIQIDMSGSAPLTVGAGGAILATGAGSSVHLSNVTGDISNAGSIKAKGELTINSGGKFTNTGYLAATENISLSAPAMALGGNISTTTADGWVDISAPGAVELGGADNSDTASATLQLGNSELDTINTRTLGIWSGAGIHFRGPVAPAHLSKALTLFATDDITQDAGAFISVPALGMYARNVDLREANYTGVIAAMVQGDFGYRSRNLLTVSEVDRLNGIWRLGATSALTAVEGGNTLPYHGAATPGTIYLQSDSPFGINQLQGAGIYTNGATLVLKTPGAVRLDAAPNAIDKLAANAGADGLRVFSHTDMEVAGSNAGINGITTSNGEVTLQAGDDGHHARLSIMQSINAGSADVDLMADRLALNANITADEASIRPTTSGRAIAVGQDCDAASCLSVTNLYRLAAGTIGIGRDAAENDDGPSVGHIHVAGISNSGSGALTDRNSATTRIGLLSHEGITQSGAIVVDELGVLGGDDVVLTDAGNRVSALVGRADAGNFSFVNAIPMTISSFVGDDYEVRGIKAAKGSISVSNTGHLKVAAGAEVQTDAGTIKLIAHSPLTVDGSVRSNSGAISLEAAANGSPLDVLTVNGKVASGGAVALKAGAGIVVNGTVDGATLTQDPGPMAPAEPTPEPVAEPSKEAATEPTKVSLKEAAPVVSGTINTVVNATTQATVSVAPRTTVIAKTDTKPGAKTDAGSEPKAGSSTEDKTASSKESGDKEERKEEKTSAASKDEGAKKHETGKKLYCN